MRGTTYTILLVSDAMDISYISRALPHLIPHRVAGPILGIITKSKDWATPAEMIVRGYEALSGPHGRGNGDIFEGLFCAALLGSGFRNLLTSAEYKILPYSKIDIVICTREGGPVMLSLKSSLRERWKQSDLEFGMIKQIRPKAFCALVSMDTDGCAQPRRLLEGHKLLGLDQVVDCNFNSQVKLLFQTISKMKPAESFKDDLLGLTNFRSFSS